MQDQNLTELEQVYLLTLERLQERLASGQLSQDEKLLLARFGVAVPTTQDGDTQ